MWIKRSLLPAVHNYSKVLFAQINLIKQSSPSECDPLELAWVVILGELRKSDNKAVTQCRYE